VFGPLGLMARGQLVSMFSRPQRIVLLPPPTDGTLLATLRELAEDGKLTPAIDRTYQLAETPAAIRYLEKDHARAKVVITVP